MSEKIGQLKMNNLETINKVFEGHEIRSIWDEDKEEYYFIVVDVIAALTNTKIPRNYWSDLKRKLIWKEVKCTKKSCS